MEPIFHSLYFLQLRIYTILLDRIDPLSRSGYYDLTIDVLGGYEARKGDVAPTLESVEILTKRSLTTRMYQEKRVLYHCSWIPVMLC